MAVGDHCWPCREHLRLGDGKLADAVIPIAYGIKREQHYMNLVTYKSRHPSPRAVTALRDLLLLFVGKHLPCLREPADGPFTAMAIVPSTGNRPGIHPLQTLAQSILRLPLVSANPRDGYEASDKTFRRDRFQVRPGADTSRVLLIEDTWTTGSRVQAMAYGLKEAGADSVVTIVLGRHLKDEHEPSRPLLALARARPFTINRCAATPCQSQS